MLQRNPRTRSERPARAAFTLIEVLIVVAIIGILASLILPGVIGARAAARRMQCANNMKQLALAINAQVSRDGTFPASGIWDVKTDSQTGTSSNTPPLPAIPNYTYKAEIAEDPELTLANGGWTGYMTASSPSGPSADLPTFVTNGSQKIYFGMMYSWAVTSLPFLARSDIYDAWDFTSTTGSAGSYLDNSTARLPNGGNFQLASTPISVFICPSDLTATTPAQGHLSYVVNGGFGFHWAVTNGALSGTPSLTWNPYTAAVGTPNYYWQRNQFNLGLMFLDTTRRTTTARQHHSHDSVRDGLSTTILVSENTNAGYKDDPTQGPPWPSNWACPHPLNTSFNVNGSYCLGAVTGVPVGAGINTVAGMYAYTAANIRGPRAPRYGMPLHSYLGVQNETIATYNPQGGINGDTTGILEGSFPYPNSQHAGGVNVAFCDGSVRFLRDTIEGYVWARLVSPAGCDVVFAQNTANLGQPAYESNVGTDGVTQLPLDETSY